VTDTNNDPLQTHSVLGRLLGPAGPELTCEQCFELLDEYVELELAQAAADEAVPGMRAHLDGCSACREEHDSLLALLATDGHAR
jgi:hypothetical protein